VISFRYHIVSLVSVFLALAVGIALGGGPLKGQVDDTLVSQVRSDRHVRSDLRDQIAALRAESAFTDAVATTTAPRLIGSALKGHVVTLVALPTAPPADVRAMSRMVRVAGGRVAGTVRVGAPLLDVGHKQLVDELGTQLEGRSSGLSIPPDDSPYERVGALLARAVASPKAGGGRVDGPATSIMAGLSTANLASVQGSLNGRGDLVLFVTGAGHGSAEQQQGASTIVTTLVQAVDAASRGVVLAGPTSAARPGGQIRAVRDDVGAARSVSTVDSLDRTAGQVVAVMALAGQAAGHTGQYGAVDAANGAMPGAPAPTG
jgi:hypothetical protein